jgi:hypothetical protein
MTQIEVRRKFFVRDSKQELSWPPSAAGRLIWTRCCIISVDRGLASLLLTSAFWSPWALEDLPSPVYSWSSIGQTIGMAQLQFQRIHGVLGATHREMVLLKEKRKVQSLKKK